MDFVPLTPEQRQSFDEDGFLVVRNVLDKQAVEQLIEAGDRRARAFLNKPELLEKEEYNHLDLRPGLLKEKPFFSLLAHSPTVPLVVQLLSPNIQLHSLALIYKRPVSPAGTPFRRGWHRDIRIPKDLGHRDLPRVGIKICYCLTDFHKPNSGMTLFARKSHLSSEALKIRKGKNDPDDVEVCDLRLNAGDAVLFENRIFHTAAPNRSDRVSRVLMYGYAYRWLKPEIYLEIPDEMLLRQADPIRRQLLGGYRDVDTAPWALQRWAKTHGVEPEPVPWTVDL
ncbi:MAG TPA: phytanoyl-CoA dioxygenase family protein [Pyrinomonadaceae bacterium]|jgi:ectoine hydroxylase-related dioxygenase (phytanoyl-CoA dioxygenase family)|nr:phytanoyl-CoA dioxygenase family protein [Pyrinomonadaceae bacterium]